MFTALLIVYCPCLLPLFIALCLLPYVYCPMFTALCLRRIDLVITSPLFLMSSCLTLLLFSHYHLR